MVSPTPPIPMEGGYLCFNGMGVAACTRCGWRGVANPGSSVCPACESDESEIVAELVAEERAWREYRGTPRNAPCPCGSGVKHKKCHGR